MFEGGILRRLRARRTAIDPVRGSVCASSREVIDCCRRRGFGDGGAMLSGSSGQGVWYRWIMDIAAGRRIDVVAPVPADKHDNDKKSAKMCCIGSE